MKNQGLSISSGVLSLLAAAALLFFLIDPFSSVAFFSACGLSLVGGSIGLLTITSGANPWNRIGTIVGLLVFLACGVIYLNFSTMTFHKSEVTVVNTH